MPKRPGGPEPSLRLSEPAGWWVLVVTAVGSGLVLLEGTVVTVALPDVEQDFGASLRGLQWTVNAFTLTLSGLILLGGALGDRFGRRRVYLVGLVWFAIASLLCGTAPTLEWLIAARALQGIGAALVVPGSLALIQNVFVQQDRARAVGWWSGLSGVAGAAGPLVGGSLVEAANWRWVFLINVPIVLVLGALLIRRVPESVAGRSEGRFDAAGAALAALGLGALTYALVQAGSGTASTVLAAAVGVAAFAAFVWVERCAAAPMLPLGLFSSRRFSSANAASFLMYGALAGMFFVLPIQLQVTSGYTPLAAGLALLPLTALTLILSARTGALTTRIGPRIPLVIGSITCAIGLLLAIRIGPQASYWSQVLPVVVLTGIGVPLITPPITSTVLSSVPADRTGIASAVSNGVARAAGLVVVAALPLLVGLPQDAIADPAGLDRGFGTSMAICAALFLAGGLVIWFGIPKTVRPACDHDSAAAALSPLTQPRTAERSPITSCDIC